MGVEAGASPTAMERSPPFSEILQSLADLDQETISLATVIAAVGTRVHGAALLLLALPEAVPLPVPSASSILGIPLLLIATHLVLFGERSGLPQRVKNVVVPRRTFRLLSRYIAPILRGLERISGPRWSYVSQRERAIGVVCAYLAIILLLPLPFFNAVPASLLALIAWGMIQKDGLVIAVGVIGSALLTGLLLAVAVWLSDTEIASVWARMFGGASP